jgi:hypothetical protein
MRLGRVLYGEWLVPIVDYFRTIKKKEVYFEWLVPFLASVLVISTFLVLGDSDKAISKLRDILPNTLAILIGFTITSLTVLIASDNQNITRMKTTLTDNRKIGSHTISLYQLLLINLVYVLFIQLFLLVFIFFVGFILHFFNIMLLVNLFLFFETFTILQIIFLLIRTITNFYFVFYRSTPI